MPTRNGSSSGKSLQSDLRYGTSISAQVETGIDNAHKQRKNASDYAKTLSDSDLAKAYGALSREYLRMSGGADAFDKENPEAGNFGSADSYVRMGADSYHDTYYVPIRDELSRRFLNEEGQPFWNKTREDKQQEANDSRYAESNKPYRILQALMGVTVSPETRSVDRRYGKSPDLSGVKDSVLSESIKIAQRGLSDISERSDEANKRFKNQSNDYVETYQKEIIDPLVNELNKRKNK
jgi:hypothetical protein